MLANKKMSSLLVALLFSTAAWGGLGGIAVRSNLGEVLRADIDLTGSVEDEIVRVGLASPDTFRDLQVDYSPALTSLRFALAYRSNGKPYIRVLSVQPISDPYLRFVVEAKTASGRSIREYTVLLDPLEYPNKADAIERSAKAMAAAEPARLKPASPAAVRIPLPAPASATPVSAAQPDFIVVKRGQTLAQVGRIARAEGATLRQTMAALVLANPSAFVNGDPATLKTGARLKVPAVATARALKSARVSEVLDGFAAPAAKPELKAAEPVLPRTAAPASTAQPVLKLEQPEQASAPAAAQDAQLKAAQQKIQELEEKLKSLQVAASAASAMAAIPAESASVPVPAVASAPEHKPAAVQPASAPEEEGPGLMSQVMDYLPLIAGGSAAVLLGVAALLFMRRRKNGAKAAAEAGGASILGANTVGRVAGVDEAGSNTFLADFTRTGMNGMDAGEVDPIAEAEVYLAYGRDQQAEDILKDALAKDPTRHEVRMKLMEIYASRQDKAAFEAQARELHAAVDGKGALWSRAAAMGLSIDPSNDLYAGDTSPAPAMAAAPAAAAAMNIDLDSELMGEPEPLPQEAFIEPEAIALEDDDPLRNALFGEPATAGAAPEPDLDLESLLSQPAPEPEQQEEVPEDKHMLDFDFNLDTPEPAAVPEAAAQPESVDDAFDFDMSTLDSLGATPASEPSAPSLDGMSLSDDPLSTKLDLARVYLDMGDKEGAREVLEELAAEAQGGLKSEAEALLASL
ncbi:hypothetical protein PQU95_11360 [Vogesella sp. DC21W]|uniref:FimV N-terminal domain-containing protein n=1 Tax=Vogesella aquatica TaxID=2984206 RepID=A0ABT5IZ24_9NEIS|nr:FimV/HubP family polar landmark protein [Vogesella aquatica]MDC7717808.1 hypothetical protein [Vogesella aquatica]